MAVTPCTWLETSRIAFECARRNPDVTVSTKRSGFFSDLKKILLGKPSDTPPKQEPPEFLRGRPRPRKDDGPPPFITPI